MKRHWTSIRASLPKYGMAAAVGALALGTTTLAARPGPAEAPSLSLLVAAVAVSVWFLGVGPALLTSGLTLVGAAMVLLDPLYLPEQHAAGAGLRLALLLAGDLVVVLVGAVTRRALARATASERRFALLARLHETLELGTDVRGRAQLLTQALVPDVADACMVHRFDGEGRLVLAAATPAAVEDHAWVTRLGLAEVADREDARRLSSAASGPGAGLAESFRLPGPIEAVAAPLRSRSGLLGVLTLVAGRDRSFSPQDLGFIDEIARRGALQLDSARLYAEQRRTAAALEQRERLKTAMLRGASHELRTPLTAIRAAADALAMPQGPETRAELLALVAEETARLERMVTNLLDLSRLEGGAITPVLAAHPADELVDVALRAARSALDGALVHVRVPSPAPIVRADTVLTERILVNLLHNAARHGGPPIEMDVESAGRTIRLTVTDGGPGVDPGVVDELFEPFVRGRDGAGAGLGLALARGLAEAQGGEVNLARSGPGTSFELLLPAGDE